MVKAIFDGIAADSFVLAIYDEPAYLQEHLNMQKE